MWRFSKQIQIASPFTILLPFPHMWLSSRWQSTVKFHLWPFLLFYWKGILFYHSLKHYMLQQLEIKCFCAVTPSKSFSYLFSGLCSLSGDKWIWQYGRARREFSFHWGWMQLVFCSAALFWFFVYLDPIL